MIFKRPDKLKTAPNGPGGNRVPPGQFLSKKFPVLTYGSTPQVDLATWQLRLFGLVEQEVELDWNDFLNLPWTVINADFHCVTQWTALNNTWEGVLFSDVMKLVKIDPNACYLMAHCYGGYTTNMSLDILPLDGAILAHKHNCDKLSRDHGWPLRLLVPRKYGWKSAKWLNGLEFIAEDQPGFREQRGYSNNADPWKEERFWPEFTR